VIENQCPDRLTLVVISDLPPPPEHNPADVFSRPSIPAGFVSPEQVRFLYDLPEPSFFGRGGRLMTRCDLAIDPVNPLGGTYESIRNDPAHKMVRDDGPSGTWIFSDPIPAGLIDEQAADFGIIRETRPFVLAGIEVMTRAEFEARRTATAPGKDAPCSDPASST
jgi:hypothetical protein